jgi:hypothetical protein
MDHWASYSPVIVDRIHREEGVVTSNIGAIDRHAQEVGISRTQLYGEATATCIVTYIRHAS